MPRDRRAMIGTGIWNEPSIRALTYAQQHAYQLVYTQPDLNRCGVISYNPRRWARFASDLTERHLRKQYRGLHETRHVVLDEDTEELFVRTYVGHDGLLAQPLVVAAMVRDFPEVISPLLRVGVVAELRRLWDQPADKVTDAERRGLLLLLGVDPETIGVGGRGDQLTRLRGVLGTGLYPQVKTAIDSGAVEPWPADADPVPLPLRLADPLVRPSDQTLSQRPLARAPAAVPSPDPDPSPDPNPDAAASGSETHGSGNGHADTDRADKLLDATGPWLDDIRSSLRRTVIEAINRRYPDDAITGGLTDWRTRDGAKPGLLAHLIQDRGKPVNGITRPDRPAWCGRCDERTRLLETEQGMTRCPDCHPAKVGAAT